MIQTDQDKKVRGRIKIPGSKSISHRAAIAAALAEGKSRLKGFLRCEDTFYTVQALTQLGAEFSFREDTLEVNGCGTNLNGLSSRRELYLGNSGTSLRLLVGVSALVCGDIVLTGSPRMQQRPIGDLVTALRKLGVQIDYLGMEGCPPVVVRTKGIKGGRIRVDASKSSQFISSLLLSAPLAERDVELEVIGTPVSRPYIDITLDVMRRFGVSVEHDGYRYFKIPPGQKYRSQDLIVEGDVSSASYFWAAAAVTKTQIITENIYPHITRQGDIRFLNILREMGCETEIYKDRVMVRGGDLTSINADMASMPDMVPTLAAVSLFAKGKTIIRNVSHLRHKESDRLNAIAQGWGRLGARIEQREDGLVIHGGYPLKPAEVDSHNDHRIAMGLAVISLKLRGLHIKDRSCVSKSFPGFWHLWERIWAKTHE
ncbi:MAG: 3-phosphoshikimate 1-carboxyvinyltransferase [Deltaproteobacteria bacterium]|nr:MAG: 3-phosphoshikimate 1-carboxyvinyltransferase [Deltaproteobacteria bacterium]